MPEQEQYDAGLIGAYATLKFAFYGDIISKKNTNNLFRFILQSYNLLVEPHVLRTIRKTDQFKKHWKQILDACDSIKNGEDKNENDNFDDKNIDPQLLGAIWITKLMINDKYISYDSAYHLLIGVMKCYNLSPTVEIIDKILESKQFNEFANARLIE